MKKNNNPHSFNGPSDNENWLDAYDVKELFKISSSTLLRWCKRGLKMSKTGGKRFWRKSEIDRFLMANERGGEKGGRSK